MEVEIDVVRRIYVQHGDGAFIEIGPDPEVGGEVIQIRTTDAASIEYFGAVELSTDKDVARAIAKALLAAVEDGRP